MVDYGFYISQASSLVLSIAYPWLAAKKDFIQIELNGRLDTLKSDWHRLNTEIRILIFTCVSGAINYQNPLLGLAYMALAFGIHWLVFDYRLNTLRGLGPWYQGQNAASDKYATKLNKWLALGLTLVLYLGACYWVLT